jgi:hypothetical protein
MPSIFPVPDKFVTCGLPVPVSVTVSAPDLVPTCVGVKVTLIAQVLPAARVDVQVLVCEKSPVTLMLLMVIAELSVFFKVTP